jgi:tetratricopeptide (TPR) repeat protein
MKRAAFLLAVLAATRLATVEAQPPQVVTLLDTYLQGRPDDAVRQAAVIADLGPLRVRFVRDAPVWIQSDAADVARRRAAAAAFLLELAHARLETDWGRLADLIEFMCVELRRGAPAPFERAWHRASMALAGRARARLWLLGEYAVLPHQKPRRRPPDSKPDPNPLHLMHALERFPDDPELQLARIVAWTWGRDSEPMRNTRERFVDEFGPMVRRAPPQAEAVKALETLTADEDVGADALVRIAQLHLTMRDPAAALRAAEQAEPRSRSSEVRYVSLMLAGRALEALARPADAQRKYRAALDLMPRAESATIALASLQFVRDERDSAVAAMRSAFDSAPAPADPWRLASYGSFMHWPRLKAGMRAELPR